MLGFLILGLILISVFWKDKKLVVIGFCILFLVLGIWRYQSIELGIMNNELINFNDAGKTITLVGIVATEPDVGEKSTKLIVDIQQMTDKMAENNSPSFVGKVLVNAWRYPEYKYGDKLKITGKLETPPVFEGFNYQRYLQKDGIYSIMSWPKIELLGQDFGNPLMSVLFSFKNKFKETVANFIPPPQEGILEALIFGDESNISKEWKDKLNLTGTRHIAAVSGMNITIIASLILSFVLFLGFWRNQAFYTSVFLLLLYILMIGASASAVRAGIMGGLLMLAQYFGRLSAAPRAITFAAFFMLAVNPLLLRFDVGFQLSFLAILGMVYLQPFFSNWLKKTPNPKIFPVRATLSATLSAQIFTLPILIYNFGRIPLISPLTNILIVPFLAPITILIFIFGVAGMIFLPFALILSWPVWLALTYVIKVIDWFSRVPLASLAIKNIHWGWLIISYLILGLIIWRLGEKQKLRFLNY